MVFNATLNNISVITWTDRQSHNNRAQTNTGLSTKKVGYNNTTISLFTSISDIRHRLYLIFNNITPIIL